MSRYLMIPALLALVASTAAAADFTIVQYTIDGGGGTSTGGGFSLQGTIGQPDAGYLTGGSFDLEGGFWTSTPTCPGDTDGDADVDLSDLALLLSQFGEVGAFAGDVNGDGNVDLTDLAIILANFGETC